MIGLDRPALSSGSRLKVATIPLVIFGSCPQEYTRAPGVVFHHDIRGFSERGSRREGKQARGETGDRCSRPLLARMTGVKSQHMCLSGAPHSSLSRKKPRDVYVYRNYRGCKVACRGRFHIVMSPNRYTVKPLATSWTPKRQSGTATLSIILEHISQQTVVATYTFVGKHRWEHSLRYSVQSSTRTQEEYTQARRIGWDWEILRF